ncbi:MAG: choline dehydrogenase [Rhodospirillaceae bacterium]|nr:choline dehydrogenase [Rhodospirillaceae bacterium]|tara:strand:- start:2988 stop:4571 length:1584 start_codon:yes stop_codon:yes gene_type:complete
MDIETYDYIVVGAGSAGSVIANRLSSKPNNKVLLLEAGPATNAWSRIPIGYAKLINNPKVNWCYSSEAEPNTNGRRLAVPRGKMLGGSSSINGLVFVRGQSRDYNTWSQLGNPGWSYQDVLPFFKRLESYEGGEDYYRGRTGPLKVTDPDETGLLYKTIMDAAEQVGVPRNTDYNGELQEGIAMSQATIANGRRMSASHCYLDPIRSRKNLKVVSEAHVTSLIIDTKKCYGVRYSINGVEKPAHSAREVVLSAGTINSPKILELSGIGNPEILTKAGVEVVHELRGVGENLRDHFAPRTRWHVGRPGITYNDRARGMGLVWQAIRYVFQKKGLFANPIAPMRAFVKTREGLEAPDALLGWVPLLYEPDYSLSTASGVTCYAHAMRPESTGHIHINSSDPHRPPSIFFNFLSVDIDIEITLKAIRIARAIMTAPAMAQLQITETAPGKDHQSDDALLNWTREVGETTYHPVGTCKMGNDGEAVVNHELKVHGIESLRIADASIMPTQVSGNTNAPSIMIGEKAADMMS